jgi:hypothetical protein
VTLPRLFYFYSKDFGKNETAVLKWIAENCPKKKEVNKPIGVLHSNLLRY